MEESKNLWNKTTAELTVGDAVKVNLAVLGFTLGSMVAVGVGFSAWEKATDKIRAFRNLRNTTTEA